MFMMVDYNTKLVLGPASYEMRAKWEAAKAAGKNYLDYRLHGFNCKIILEERK